MVEIYKKGQGIYARWVAAIFLGALALFGVSELRSALRASEWAKRPLGLGLDMSTLVAAILFLVAAGAIAWLVNWPRFVDYLISAEVELRKVSWPTRLELKRQTIVVIVALLMFSVMLFVADMVFGFSSGLLYGLQFKLW